MKKDLPYLCIMGPTGIGKTNLVIDLYQKYPIDIISVDSVMVYRHFNIGSAKPTAEEQKIAPHHLIDIREPQQIYSLAEFCRDAAKLIYNSHEQNRIPVLVGGSMMYFHGLQAGIRQAPGKSTKIRDGIKQQVAEYGIEYCWNQLYKIDPLSAENIAKQDTQRITRALEVFQQTGKPISSFSNNCSIQAHKAINLLIMPADREELKQNLSKRFLTMLDSGLIDEVANIIQLPGICSTLPCMKSIGYRQVYHYLQNNLEYSTLKQNGIIASHQYAKRQLTWLRNWKHECNYITNENTAKKAAEQIMANWPKYTLD